MNKAALLKKIFTPERISVEEGVRLFSLDFLELAAAGDYRRRLARDDDHVGFIVDRIINYTNVCEAMCRFCAYHARAGKIDAYELSLDEILAKVDELVRAGGSQVMLQGGLSKRFTLDRVLDMVRGVKAAFPEIYLHSFSPAEVMFFAANAGVTPEEVVAQLKSSGVSSIPGASDLLVDEVRRRVSPNKITVAQWSRVMDALKENGMTSTATMTYGFGETIEQRVEHLAVVRDVQDRTGILRAFIPWSFSPKNTDMNDVVPATGLDYLKVIAVSRIFLDNITHIQAGWLTEGLKLAQTALAMGANDMGGVLTEELVVQATGVATRTSLDELVDVIKNAGRVPVLRDSRYESIRVFT